MLRSSFIALALISAAPAAIAAESVTATVNRISEEGVGGKIGEVAFSDSDAGLVIEVKVAGLSKGQHGLHIHEKGDCGAGEKDGKKQAGLAAGPHLDPGATKSHQGPDGAGHTGDLPFLEVSADGKAAGQLVAKRLKLADVKGRSLMIHEGGDSYSDTPEMGGGKARIACAVIPQ